MHPTDTSATGLEIALVGMVGRFPSARSVDELWQRLLEGQECITVFSDEQLREAGISADTLADPQYVKASGCVAEYDRFDAGFFGYSPREAALMDPQQRVFLECAWEALEHAGYAPGTIRVPVGVFGGTGISDYFLKHVLPAVGGMTDHQTVVANDKDYLTTRVSYKLNLEGPSLAVQTACSTSLVAVHLACQSLIAGECDMALAGGVTIRLPQHAGYHFQEEGIASPDGHCRAFSADARGCLPGSGAAIVVLKRLTDAVADGDTIHAVIKGSAINNDGARKIGYTAPRVDGQAQVIRAALNVAGVSAASIGYLEAHGTGTVLGDPIEIEAATKAFRQDTDARGYCAVGAIKTNVGHLDAAAGVTGLIKAALTVKHGVIPPSLHFDRPNPQIAFEQSPFFVNSTRRIWTGEGQPRRAAVSSFGIGGTNAHVVLEQPPQTTTPAAQRSELILVSAKSETALAQASVNLSQHLSSSPGLNLSDVAYTLQQGRASFKHRRALVARDLREAAERLADPSAGRSSVASDARVPRVVFMFPGQGSQFAGMGRELYETYPEFRHHIDAASALLAPHLGFELRAAITAADGAAEFTELLRDTRVAQPAIFSVAHALARLLMSWGVMPSALIGHSIGEYVAACLAGVFSAEDALTLVAARGRLMGGVAPGGMMAVPLSRDALMRDLPDDIAIAALNAPQVSVVAGPHDAVERFRQSLSTRGIEARPLHTSHAFHSSMMDPVLPAFTERVRHVRLGEPQIPLISNVTGTWMRADQATDPSYWAQHLRQTVRFSEGLQAVLADDSAVLLEVGPGQTLSTLAARHQRSDRKVISLPTTRRADVTSPSDTTVLLETAGALWTHGLDINWGSVNSRKGRRIPLPTYPFQRERHWIERAAPERDSTPAPPPAERDLSTWFSVPTWTRMPRPKGDVAFGPAPWVVFADAAGVGEALAGELRRAERNVFVVSPGSVFARIDDRTFQIDPGVEDHYHALCAALQPHASGTLGVIHCWNVASNDAELHGLTNLESHATRGFYSLLALAKALGTQQWLTNCHLTVVSSGVHEVVGGETICPEKALVLGPCRVIPLEYDGMGCTHVDVALTPGRPFEPATIARLIETIREQPTSLVAIRGAVRWQQTIAPLPLAAVERPSTLRERGVYVITGGLGGVGLAIADCLARLVRARLILVSRTGLPPASTHQPTLEDARVDAEAAIATLSQREPRITSAVPLSPMAAFEGLLRTLDDLAAALVLDYFRQLGVDASEWTERSELARRCGVLPSFQRLFARMLNMLLEDGWIVAEGTKVRFLERRWPRFDEATADARARYPQMAPIVALLDTCARQYPAALSGAVPAMSLLFGEEHRDTFRRAVDTVREHSYVPLCEALVKQVVSDLTSQSRRGTLRILEIGGGEGRLTQVLTPVLAGRHVEYQFTDIGRSFVLNAEREAERRGHDFMKCRVLDISRPPSSQGFAAGSVDVVLAFNVLHATTSIADSLAHAAELLAPGGLLILQESVRPSRWVDLVWGLTDGWFAFTDEPRRSTSPLLTLDGWSAALAEAGFSRVSTYPLNEDVRAHADTGVIVACKAAQAARPAAPRSDRRAQEARDAIVRSLQSHGADVSIVAADVADREAMREVVQDAVTRYGRIDGVIHAALVLNDGAMQLKSKDAVERVFAPKVTGTLVLEELCEGRDLDFFVVFSSLVSIFGGAGQVDYCAASNFQDAWAHALPRSTARLAMSINWGAWREVGMAFRAAVERGAAPDAALPDGMSPHEGVQAFLRALESGQPQMLIMPTAAESESPRRGASIGQSSPAASAAPVATEVVSREVRSPQTDVEQLIAGLWKEVLGLDRVGLDDNFFDLGGDSMISLQFIAKAKKAGLRFTNRQVFEHQTVAELAAVATGADDRSATPDRTS